MAEAAAAAAKARVAAEAAARAKAAAAAAAAAVEAAKAAEAEAEAEVEAEAEMVSEPEPAPPEAALLPPAQLALSGRECGRSVGRRIQSVRIVEACWVASLPFLDLLLPFLDLSLPSLDLSLPFLNLSPSFLWIFHYLSHRSRCWVARPAVRSRLFSNLSTLRPSSTRLFVLAAARGADSKGLSMDGRGLATQPRSGLPPAKAWQPTDPALWPSDEPCPAARATPRARPPDRAAADRQVRPPPDHRPEPAAPRRGPPGARRRPHGRAARALLRNRDSPERHLRARPPAAAVGALHDRRQRRRRRRRVWQLAEGVGAERARAGSHQIDGRAHGGGAAVQCNAAGGTARLPADRAVPVPFE